MAPEQTTRSAREIGPWTDVYLLGGTLYYLLTGGYPHEAATARGAIQKSLAGIVDPPESRAPNRLVPPELRALVLQAMAFEPSERTGSALEFIARLQDYLSGASRRRQAIELAEKAGETLSEAGSSYEELEECLSLLARSRALWPDDSRAAALRDEALSAYAEAGLGAGDLALARVQASRVAEEGARADLLRRVEAAEAAARAQARQRRWALAASATLLAVVILGGGLSWRRIAEERDAALENARQARRARGDSEALARFMISDLRPRLKELERLDLLDETARRALGHYLRQDAGDLAPDERVAVARGLNSLGQLLLEQGDTAQALVAYRATLDLCGGLPARTLDAAPWRAIEADALNGATDTMQRRGDLAAALNSSDRAVARARELARLDPEDARRGQRLYLDSLLRRAQLVATRGLVVEATELGREAVELAGRHAERSADQRLWRHLLSRALAEYSDALALAGRLDEALALSLNALEDARTRAGDLPDDSNARRDLVAALVRASDFANRSGRAGQAKELAADALARISALSRTDPLNMSLQRDLAVGLNKVGLAAMDTGAIEEARSCFAEAVAMLRRLSDLDPRNRTWRRDLSVSMDLLADSLRRLRRQEEALALYDETLEFARVALSLDPENVQLMRDVAIGNEHRGMALGELGRQEDSLAAMMEGLAAWRDLLRASPGSAPSQEGLAFGLEKVGTALSKLGRKEEGIERLREAAAHLEELRDAFPHDEHYGASVGLVRCASGLALMELERFDEGRAELTAAIDALRPACAREPENMLWSSNLAHALEGLGTSCSSKGLHEEALRHLAAAAEERRRIADYAPNDYARARALAVSYGILGSGHSTAGDPASALASLLQGREAIARLERIVPDSPDAAMLDQFFTSYIAAFHLQLGQTDDARAAIGELIESGWKEPALYAAAKAAGIDVPEELLPAMNEAEAEPGQSADAPGDSAAAAE
jgi:tetratricopeptide (TPR) repeat protein